MYRINFDALSRLFLSAFFQLFLSRNSSDSVFTPQKEATDFSMSVPPPNWNQNSRATGSSHFSVRSVIFVSKAMILKLL